MLGRFAATVSGKPVFEHLSLKAQECLAYLILNRDRPHRREALAKTLWGDPDRAHGRKCIRQTLWQLKRALYEAGEKFGEILQAEGDWVRLDYKPNAIWADAVAFVDLSPTNRESKVGPVVADRFEAAANLYHGDLLEGWYQGWLLDERDRFRQQYMEVLARLTAHNRAKSDYESAIKWATLALKADRANERMHQTLMDLYLRSGDRTAALRQFERCRLALREELDLEPGPEITALFEQIRLGHQ